MMTHETWINFTGTPVIEVPYTVHRFRGRVFTFGELPSTADQVNSIDDLYQVYVKSQNECDLLALASDQAEVSQIIEAAKDKE